MPWVRTDTHLGNELCEDGMMDTDTKKKNAAFKTRSLELREQFIVMTSMTENRFKDPKIRGRIEINKLKQKIKEPRTKRAVYCCDQYDRKQI